jgi:hypothetical protein
MIVGLHLYVKNERDHTSMGHHFNLLKLQASIFITSTVLDFLLGLCLKNNVNVSIAMFVVTSTPFVVASFIMISEASSILPTAINHLGDSGVKLLQIKIRFSQFLIPESVNFEHSNWLHFLNPNSNFLEVTG